MLLFLANGFTESLAKFFTETSPFEWFGVFTGLLCVWLAAKNNIWNWPFAIASVLTYIFIFFESKLYADMGLQFYLLLMNIYGWYYWSKQRKNPGQQRPISQITQKEVLLSLLGIAVFTVVLGLLLHKKTDASFPFVDSFCTATSIIAQVFLARRVLQNWLIWVFVDIIYVIVYFSKELYATGLMYAIYMAIALMGYIDWKKIYREQTN